MSEKFRMAVRFSREEAARFVSHLDMQRVFSRALRRTGLPVQFSQGFNPHVVMSFAQALAVGLATRGDYMEFALTQAVDPEEVRQRLDRELPAGMRALKAGALAPKAPKLMAAVTQAEYLLLWEDPADGQKLQEVMERERFPLLNKKGKEIDGRPLIHQAELVPQAARVRLALKEGRILSPYSLVAALEAKAQILRVDLLTGEPERPASLETLFEMGRCGE